MRCPRCGYISFDQIEKCLKCGKNVIKVSVALKGSIPNVVAPEYLMLEEDAVFQEADEGVAGDGFMAKEPAVEEPLQDDDTFMEEEETLWLDGEEEEDINMGGFPSGSVKAGVNRVAETAKKTSLDEDFDLDLDLGDLDFNMTGKKGGSPK